MTDDESLPKYRRRGFMAKQYSLYHTARIATRLAQRYGNNDAPIAPVTDVASVRRVDPVTDTFTRSDDFNDF
jgi:hypothetical protein